MTFGSAAICASAGASAGAGAGAAHFPNIAPGLAGLVVHLARGFGPSKKKKGKGAREAAVPDTGDEDNEEFRREAARARKNIKAMRGKLIPCEVCKGKGKRICQFCKGTTRMKGFLGTPVPCIPCEETGVLPIPCKECKGMGFFQP